MAYLEAILGAFVTGILFRQMPRLPKLVHEQLKVHLWRLTDATVLAMALIVLGAATCPAG